MNSLISSQKKEMGSSYFGEPNMGNEKSSSSSSGSSRKGKKNHSDKPKQPQRGLGVAQLEKIRLHSQLGSNYFNPPHVPLHGHPYQEDMRFQRAYSPVPSPSTFTYSATSSTSSAATYGFRPNMMMGFGELERANIRYEDMHQNSAARWNPSEGLLGAQHFVQPNATQPIMNLQEHVDLMQKKRKKEMGGGSSMQNSSKSKEAEEVDLELRLSL